MSDLALELIRENKKTQAPFLDLRNCGLTELPKELLDCVWLKRLNLGDWYYDETNRFIRSQNNGLRNSLSNNTLQPLKELSNLQSLYLSENNISDIGFLEKLTQLQTLDLTHNPIRDYSFLEKLTQLQNLYLSGNQITDLYFLSRLTQLQNLDLSRNPIRDYSFLEKLSQLQSLNLSNNQMTYIQFLGKLTTLQRLNLSLNLITDVRFLEKLTLLQSLDLSHNQITDISPLLPLLKKNNPLIISLDDFDFDNKLNLNKNPLSIPPIEIVQQGNEAVLTYFSELEKQGKYYLYEAKMLVVGQPRAGKTSLRYKLFDQKAALPGEEDTTRGIDIQSLEFVIADQDKKNRKFKYNVWDFGGQQIYQSTHQFFLTHRSLYILVMDTGKDSVGNDDSTMNYWLQAVELLGGNSPMLLLRNEKNERKFTVDLSTKKARFPFLKEDYGIDLNALIPGTSTYKADQETAFRRLKEDIEIELKRLPLVGFPMPKNWVKIREELQQLSLKKPYISQQDYFEICETHKVTEYEQQRELSRIFHDLGVFLHFQDQPALDEFVILQNVWATDAVFAVLDNPDVIASKGKFTDKELTSIWQKKNYEPKVHRRLLELMKQFELCYQVENSSPSVYIIPEMLAEKSPAGYEWIPQNDLPLQYHYDFMPKGILTRLIVRLHRHIARNENNEQIVWKSGIKIDGTSMDCPSAFAEITEAWDNKQLLIRVQGRFSKELMSQLTREIDSINEDFFKQVSRDPASQKSKWYKMIPCNCSVCKDNANKYYYDYSRLLERKGYGRNTVECDRIPFEMVLIDTLLEGVFSKNIEKRPDNNPDSFPHVEKQAKKVFISYSHEDLNCRDQAQKYLVNLVRDGLIEIWHDKVINPGQKWDDTIKSKLSESDIVILLVSQDFIASTYSQETEMRIAFENKEKGKATIIPFLLDDCDWQDWKVIPLSKTEEDLESDEWKMGNYQFMPLTDDKQRLAPLRDKQQWPNESRAWMKLTNYIRTLVK